MFVLLRNDYMRTGKIRHKRGEERKNQTVIIMATKIIEDNTLVKVTVANLIFSNSLIIRKKIQRKLMFNECLDI